MLWASTFSEPPLMWEIRDSGVPYHMAVIALGTNLVAWGGGNLSWIQADGTVRWTDRSLSTVTSAIAGPDGTICVIRERTCVLVKPDGTQIPVATSTPLVYTGWACDSAGTFYLSGRPAGEAHGSRIVATAPTGAIRWEVSYRHPPGPFIVGLDDRLLTVANTEAGTSILKLSQDGTVYWSVRLGTSLASLQLGDADGNLYADIVQFGRARISSTGDILSLEAGLSATECCADSSGLYPVLPSGVTPLAILEDGTVLGFAYNLQVLPYPAILRLTPHGEARWIRRVSPSTTWACVSGTGQIFVLSTTSPFVSAFDGRIPPSRAGWPTPLGPLDGSRRMVRYSSPAIHAEGIRWLADSGFHLAIGCTVGERYQIESSTDLNSWSSVTNFTATERRVSVTDPQATDGRPRVYRATREP